MMRHLRIENFKAFRDQSLELAPLTLLTGLNGSGKSSVLQALLVLRQSFDQGLLQKGRLALDGGLVRLGTFQDALFESASEERIAFEIDEDVESQIGRQRWEFTFGSKDDRVSAESANGQRTIGPCFVLERDFDSCLRSG